MSKTSEKPLYKKIIEDILHLIENGELKPGDRLPTEMDLIKKYGVSRITVSKAMADLKSREVIERYHHKGTFVRNPKKEALSASFKQIVFIIPKMIDQFALSIVKGIQSGFPSEKYMLSIIPCGDSRGESHALNKCLEIGVEGLIIFPADQEYYSDQVLSMKINKYPFVLIDRFFPGIDTNYVISDNVKSGKMAVNYLHRLGHRRIAVFSDAHQTTYSVDERIRGYRLALEEQGILAGEGLIYAGANVEKDPAELYGILDEMIRGNGVTAIISMQSKSALLLYHTLKSMGIKVPGDISLLCFDNPLSDIEDFQFFTYIFQNEFQMGFQAAEILRDLIENKTDTIVSPKKIILEPTLIISSSTAAPHPCL